MPKKTARRIIDTRKDTGTTIIGGVTLSGGSSGGAATPAMAGDGLTYNSGVLDVGAGTLITVGADSVGITAGANYQYIGTGSGTAAAWQNLSTLAGSGLTHSAGVLAVGAGNGITVAADSVALTTPGTLTVSTSNNAASNHTHAITSSSNPGAAASILASTASGGLTLQSLAVQGSVDVTNGGDLTVAGSGSYAGSSVLFVDSSGGNVGIMGAPDPQFALDIVGPCRATWFIGPHAIQLKNVLFLAHYDGREPFATNTAGELNGHMGQVGTPTNSVIFREGKFGKALQVAEATTNLVTNPSFETNTTSWAAIGAGSSIAQSSEAYLGSYGLAVTVADVAGAGVSAHASSRMTVTASNPYTFSLYAKASLTESYDAALNIVWYTAGGSVVSTSTTNVSFSEAWERYVLTATAPATAASAYVSITRNQTGTATYYIDAVQFEQKAYATPYCDGSLGGYNATGVADGTSHAWSGSAHASTSLRSAARLQYLLSGNIDPAHYTIMAWVRTWKASGNQEIVRIDGTVSGNIVLRLESGSFRAIHGTVGITDSGSYTAGTWAHVAMTLDGTDMALYVNGQEVATGTAAGFSGRPTSFDVGSSSGSSNFLSGQIDDLCIVGKPLSAEQILSVYESDAPVFAESSRFSFRATPQGLVWADDEGLWMRNSTGSAVFGAYGGASTKSWAGLTLSPSDIVMGDSSRGSYAWWDDSAGAFAIGRSGTDRVKLTSAGVLSINDSGGNAVFTFDASAGAEFTKPLTMATTGGIYQGSGTFASPTTGLKIWNDSGVGRIGGYNSGALQWYAGTDGKFYTADADGDALRLDSTGLRLRMTSGSETFANVVWCRPISTADITTNYHGKILSTYVSGTKTAYMQFRTYVNTDTDSSYVARTVIEAQGKVSGSTSGASMEVVRSRTAYYINMNAEWVGFGGYTQHGVFGSTPSITPATGYLVVWFSSSGSNYVLNVKNSAGTVKSVTLT